MRSLSRPLAFAAALALLLLSVPADAAAARKAPRSSVSRRQENIDPTLPTIGKCEGNKVCLNGFTCDVTCEVTFPLSDVTTPVPYTVVSRSTGETLFTGEFNRTDADGMIVPDFVFPFTSTFNGWNDMNVTIGSGVSRYVVQVTPAGVTIIPIIITLIVAFWSREVLPSLLFGIFLTATFINNYNPIIGFERTLDTYMANAVADRYHALLILLTFWLGSLVCLVQKSGGAAGLGRAVSKYAKNRWGAQWYGYALGWIIFFDDYASCLIVGNQMRPITDEFWVSREKLAFITHTTSAAPASIVPMTSWIGFELSLLTDAMRSVGSTMDPWTTLLETIPSRYYPFFMLYLIPILLIFKREFGPMLGAERRAMRLHQLQPPDMMVEDDSQEFSEFSDEKGPQKKIAHWAHAMVPIVVCIVVIIISLFLTGYYICVDNGIPITASNLSGNGDSYYALTYGAFIGALWATIQYKIFGVLTLKESVQGWLQGIRSMIEALMVLIMAWAISNAIEDLGTATFIVSAAQGGIDWRGLPALIFLLCCIMSFCTGSSWGTMAIVFPLAIPLAVGIAPPEYQHVSLVDTASAILSGSIFGDQCSPISDTTILTTIASRVAIHPHIMTQIIYSCLCAVLAIVIGLIPLGYQAYPAYAGLLLGIPVLVIICYLLGTPVESDKPDKLAFLYSWRKSKVTGETPAAEGANPETSAPRIMTTEEAFGDVDKFHVDSDIPMAGGHYSIPEQAKRAVSVEPPEERAEAAAVDEEVGEKKDAAVSA
ncbi:Na+/H+ antiporter family-domain-containing protein [Hyaloraphidium curvatum]|nr:Na+/H+ antiporter family-domain-containing protein [Hyaloraphidium curvatum]